MSIPLTPSEPRNDRAEKLIRRMRRKRTWAVVSGIGMLVWLGVGLWTAVFAGQVDRSLATGNYVTSQDLETVVVLSMCITMGAVCGVLAGSFLVGLVRALCSNHADLTIEMWDRIRELESRLEASP